MTAHAPSEEILIRPDAAAWRGALLRERAASLSEETKAFRHEVGLPTDRPIVMSGHQPTLWHPGILAKWLAMVHAAGSLGAHAAWIVVDHDEVSPLKVKVPARDQVGVLTARECDLAIAEFAAHTPASARPASPVRVPVLAQGETLVLDGVRAGIGAIVAACNAFATERSAAAQVSRATARLVHTGVLADSPEPTLLFATALDHTRAFRGLVARISRDPRGCVNAYNTAARAHPQAGIRELDTAGDLELPVWIMEAGTRRSARASDLGRLAESPSNAGHDRLTPRLAPKALLMTLLLRLHGCDLFIHGLGGGGSQEGAGYDEVMQDWATGWLGVATLAPMATVTATLRLPFEGEPPVSIEAARRAEWTAWHARNEPAILGDAALSQKKRSLASAIAALPWHDSRRRPAFLEMRRLVEQYQGTRAVEFASLEAQARSLHARAASDVVRLDRTWPFPFYSNESLRALRRDVEAGLSLEGRPVS